MITDRVRVEVTRKIDAARQAVKMRRDADALRELEACVAALREHVEALEAPTMPPPAVIDSAVDLSA